MVCNWFALLFTFSMALFHVSYSNVFKFDSLKIVFSKSVYRHFKTSPDFITQSFLLIFSGAVAKPARLLVMLRKYFCVHGPRKQSISKEMNNDNNDNDLSFLS